MINFIKKNNTVIDPIIVGKIGSPYRLNGWLKLVSYTEISENIFNYHPWFIKSSNNFNLIKLENWKYINTNLIIKFKNINNRENAILLSNYKIIINSSTLPNLKNGEYYWNDILKCRIINIKGNNIGKVIDIINTGSNDVLVVSKNKKFCKKTNLIPFILNKVIKNIDIINHIIKVDWEYNI